ncbi:hypothetical protein DdX_19980 [Ditylenchus destructor]|uniref:Uncharacterized protein n=1 Tax=Ditylenchus destructor TaxID=166010 RepID=A0AAD4MIK3_9BILA|nr:hypothetical protein DdX_19980 [Ditylenchus destructor]
MNKNVVETIMGEMDASAAEISNTAEPQTKSPKDKSPKSKDGKTGETKKESNSKASSICELNLNGNVVTCLFEANQS